MDVAALSLKIDSSDLVRASAELDKFSASASKAGATAGDATRSAADKMASGLSRSAQSAIAAASAVDRYAASNTGAAATAAQAAQAAMRSAQAATSAGAAARASAAGWDMLTGRMNSNFVAINKNLQALGLIPAAANRANRALNDNVNAMQATPGNIAAQFQDIGVTAAMGMSPLLIALQQGTQLSAAFAGGMGGLGAALRQMLNPTSLLTIGVVALVAYIIQLGMEMLSTADDAGSLADRLSEVKFSSNALQDAQGILGGVLDITTGKMHDQTDAARALARAQLLVAQVSSQAREAEARARIQDSANRSEWNISGGFGGGFSISRERGPEWQIESQFRNGIIGAEQAVKKLEQLRAAGSITAEVFAETAAAYANLGVEMANQKIFEDAQRLLDGDTRGTGYLLDPKKERTRRGGKTDAERLADIMRNAQEAITAEENRAKAVNMSAVAAAELEQRTKLLNAAASAGLKITPQLTAEIDRLSKAYAAAKVNADVSEVVKSTTDEIERQREAVADQVKLIGLYGDALARAQRELEAQRKLRDSLPEGEIVVASDLTGRLSDDIEAANRAERMERIRKDAEDTAYALELERGALGLTGAAALEYAFVAERLNDAKREGIELSPQEVAAIQAAGAAYAQQRYAIDQAADAIADAREVTRGFFSDWINGAREGQNVFSSFADSAVNSLNRIIDKLLDRTLDGFLDSMFAGGLSFLGGGNAGVGGSVINLSSAHPDPLGGLWEFDPIIRNAKGGAYGPGGIERFAKGGAFTNSIVSAPTLFRFANGAALGEMGEAGPEAIMPLKRGPNGALGVQLHGGGRGKAEINVQQDFHMQGVMTPDDVAAMVRQGAAAAVEEVRRNLEAYLREWEVDGAVAT